MRGTASQPSYDFLTGEPSRSVSQPLRETMRQSASRKVQDTENAPDAHDHLRDELRAEIKTLKYTISTMEQEKELATLRHDSELRETRRKAEEDFSRMQAAEAEKAKAVRQCEAAADEMTAMRDASIHERSALERKLRDAEEQKRLMEEEVDDLKTAKEDSVRGFERKVVELEARNHTLQRTIEEIQHSSTDHETLLQTTQQTLAQRESEIGNLESEVLRLKAQAGDADTLAIIKRELSEQVATIRSLEAKNREQLTELKHLRKLNKSVEVVEEEKRELQRKLDRMDALEQELGEAHIQRQRLEDERLSWTAYLNSQGPDGQVEFATPEAMAQALSQERLETASLVEKLGRMEPALTEKDNIIQSLEDGKAKLVAELEALKASDGSDLKMVDRLERQRALAVKEVDYLRAQLQTFDAEETMNGQAFDEQKTARIKQLEEMVDQYRGEVQTLHKDLSLAQSQVPAAGTKRTHDSGEEAEKLGQLLRKVRKLQDELATQHKSNKVLSKELSVAQEKFKTLSEPRQTRVLSLRANPTADCERIKMETLRALQAENADLLAQIQNGSPGASVPASALVAAQRATADVQQQLESERKTNDRLKKVWLAKSQEFRELVVSLLGWDVVFMPNGKMRVTSFFYPSTEDHENSIVFDGDKGTMKVSGGPQSLFALKIMDQIKFWVKERESIPCLLAALTLEFYEEQSSRARND